MGQRNQKRNKKNTLRQIKMEIWQKIMGYSKSSSKCKVHTDKCLHQETRSLK